MPSQLTVETFASASAVIPSTLRAEERTVDVCWYGGATVPRIDRSSGESYMLKLDPSGARLDRLNSGAPIFDSHLTGMDFPSAMAGKVGMRAQAGVVIKAWTRGDKCYATLRFDAPADPKDDILWPKIQSGIAQNLSFGAWIYAKEPEEASGGSTSGVFVATDWEPFEISVVTVPADYQTEFLNAATAAGEHLMPETITGTPQPKVVAGTETNRAIIAAEVGKLARINGLEETFTARLASSATTMEDARVAILNHLAEEADRTPILPFSTGLRDERDTQHDGMLEALFARATNRAPSERARPWYGRRLPDIARECLRLSGQNSWGSDSHVVTEALSVGSQGTTDLPNLLSNLANKLLLASYAAVPSGIRVICKSSTANDFKMQYRLKRGEYPTLELVLEHGEVHQGPILEAVESYQVKTYGRIVSLTRQAIVNDDLGALQTLTSAIGAACANFEAQFLTDLLTSNAALGPTLTDTKTLFHADHNNLNTGGGSALGITALSTARLGMRSQVGIDGVTLVDANPRYLLVPAALQTTAEALVATLYATTIADQNPFAGKLEVVVEPRLDAVSGGSTRWYCAADPALVPALEYSYLADAPGPQTVSRVGFEVLAVETRVTEDYGAGVIDHRGICANVGV